MGDNIKFEETARVQFISSWYDEIIDAIQTNDIIPAENFHIQQRQPSPPRMTMRQADSLLAYLYFDMMRTVQFNEHCKREPLRRAGKTRPPYVECFVSAGR